ncbi:MAG TPA: hypothetical protein VFA00_02670 [Actinomycetota bacterium]|jgi:hypothetical protein|nr:hypothetical protein [Actinomycetota bacterium]
MSQLQLRFDEGHQQRYFSDRRALLECVLRVAAQSPHPRFEVWGEGRPVLKADGTEAGRRFELLEVLDLREAEARERVGAELAELASGEAS